MSVEKKPAEGKELQRIKIKYGVPEKLYSCHTALIGGYVVEGHVPADIIKRLLSERPPIAGIAVPGMPEGSPGMEGPDPQPYEVFAFEKSGKFWSYARIDPRRQ
ncbi:MAG TPA: DUF411 domain-containing protein [candidate division Zixibacteria bacterium]|nr:DUF411 domain-containing protein [candidate division Zixibacteria bacterium]